MHDPAPTPTLSAADAAAAAGTRSGTHGVPHPWIFRNNLISLGETKADMQKGREGKGRDASVEC